MRVKAKNDTEWNDWFAWFPVYMETFYVWNEKVQRRRVWVDVPQDCMYGSCYAWEYRLIRDK